MKHRFTVLSLLLLTFTVSPVFAQTTGTTDEAQPDTAPPSAAVQPEEPQPAVTVQPTEPQPTAAPRTEPAPLPAAAPQTEPVPRPAAPPRTEPAPRPAAPRPAAPRPDALQSYRTGRDLETRGRTDEANRYYNEAVRICTDEIARGGTAMDSYAVLTWALNRQKKYAEVVSWGDRGLRITADYRIIETMGEAYFYLYNYNESLRYLQRYVNALPQGDRASVAYFFIGEIYRLQGKFRHADIAYTTAVRLDPSAALWWYRLGSVRESSGELAPAAEAYERALRLNPNYREATEGLARSRTGPAG